MFVRLALAAAIGSCALGVEVEAPAAAKAVSSKRQASALNSGKGRAAKGRAQQHAAAAIDPSPNATLTAEQSAALDAAAACGESANSSFAQVEGAVAVVNSTAITFLDSVTAAIDTAQQSLLAVQSSASSALKLAGIDDGFLGDFVSQVSAKISDTLLVLNETNEDLKASLSDVLSEYSAEREEINESLAVAVASTREGLLASAEEATAAAAANASETFLAAKHTSIMMGPKSTAAKAIEKVNATADKLIEMLSQLNTTLVATLMDDVVDKINSSACKMQDALTSGEEKFPGGVPSSITDTVDAIFDQVFATIDAIKPAEVNSQLAPKVQAATADTASLGACVAPLSTIVEDMDGAWPRACSWSMLSALAALSLSRSAMQ